MRLSHRWRRRGACAPYTYVSVACEERWENIFIFIHETSACVSKNVSFYTFHISFIFQSIDKQTRCLVFIYFILLWEHYNICTCHTGTIYLLQGHEQLTDHSFYEIFIRMKNQVLYIITILSNNSKVRKEKKNFSRNCSTVNCKTFTRIDIWRRRSKKGSLHNLNEMEFFVFSHSFVVDEICMDRTGFFYEVNSDDLM